MRLILLTLILAAQMAVAQNPSEDASMSQTGPFLPSLNTLPLLDDTRTRSICAENPTGEPGRGGMAVPDPTEEKPAASARAADDLGRGWKVRPFLRVNAGETALLMDVDGPGVIQHIWMVEGLSRAHILRFYWDNEETPSIEVPAPDFFAVGHEMFARVDSAVVTVNPQNALNCYWPMPFREHCRVTLTNEADTDLGLLAYQITYAETDVPENAGYLHAQWRRGNSAEENPHVIFDGVNGQGRYVGTFLAWTQLSRGWFGEGEIKFFMDGDGEFPTICGTGTEDYFCGSYGFPEVYNSAYAGTTIASNFDGDLPQYWSLYRWHVMDPICFAEDLRVTIQALGWGADGKYALLSDDISSVAYWYQNEPHAPFPALPALEARRRWEPSADVEGALEGEAMRVVSCSGGNAKPQDLRGIGSGWSGKAQLFWIDGVPGDILELALPIESAATYRVTAQLTKAFDYATVQLSLDGTAIGEPYDAYHEGPMPSGPIDLGVHELEVGEHTLAVEILGCNEAAEKRYAFGLDYLLLQSEE